jgi:glycosyltransferase involved in cell wall biosynthesis
VAHRRVVFPLQRLSRLKYGRMDRLVAVSDAIAQLLERHGLPRTRIAVIHDALPTTPEEWSWVGVAAPSITLVDAARRRRSRDALAAAFGLDPTRPWIGNLAALGPDKDHHTLISAVPLVGRKHPAALFLIAGRGPEERRLRQLIAELGVHDRVLLLGQVDDPGSLLAALDLFALSSRGEGMGSVLLEAAACGVPVVATAAGGLPEVVRHRETGLLAPPGDPAALAGCLVELLDDPALARRLALAATAALPRFGLRRAAERFEQLYHAVATG